MNPKRILKAIFPANAIQMARDMRYAFGVFRSLAGVFPRECPVCNYHGMFHAFGNPPRYDALCPKCGSLERHRLIRLALNKNPLPTDATVIHFAPEGAVAAMLPRKNYRSADLEPGKAELVLNLESIALPSQSVDVVVVNHVLEHVNDDRQALAELFRILREDGLLIEVVPFV
jgi:SAM-dependent methyltransferase